MMLEDKAALRRAMLERRAKMPPQEIALRSARITRAALEHPAMLAARRILSYMPVRGEVDTAELNQALFDRGIALALPAVRGGDMTALSYERGQALRPGGMRIPEPVGGREVKPEEIDLVLVPGVAFTMQGDRLGYGKGYFDRYIGSLRPECMLLGLAYDFQIVPTLPVDPWDRRLDSVLTDSMLSI